MKLSSLLLASLVESGRDWSLLDKYKLMRNSDFTTGGLLQPRQLEDDTSSIREQGRVFPFCSSGTPADDNCYRKCDPDAGCQSELVFYTTVQEDIAQCRKKTAKRINKADACIKLANNNPLISGQINYNGELDGFHVHKTVEIRAPYGNYVSVTVEDFNIGNKTIEMGGKEVDDLCGYGSIFIFAGQGSINQMIKVVEFCGSKDSPIIDYQNKNYLGIQDSDTTDLVDGETHTIISNRIIMAIMTQENFSADTVGSATADIKWDIVTAPEGELLRGVDYMSKSLIDKWRLHACTEFSEFSVGEGEDGECAWKDGSKKRIRKFQRYYKKVIQMIEKLSRKSHLRCYANNYGPTFRFEANDPIIQQYNQIQSAFIKNSNMNSVSVFDVMRQMHSRLLVDCKLGIFWLEKMNDAEKVFNNLLGIETED